MDRIRIVGGRSLNGTIPISGAKNAALPLMIASLLTDQTLILENVPRLAAALRENLKRRKQQARQRATDQTRPAGASSQDTQQDSEQDTEQNGEADIGTTGAAPDFRRNRNGE